MLRAAVPEAAINEDGKPCSDSTMSGVPGRSRRWSLNRSASRVQGAAERHSGWVDERGIRLICVETSSLAGTGLPSRSGLALPPSSDIGVAT